MNADAYDTIGIIAIIFLAGAIFYFYPSFFDIFPISRDYMLGLLCFVLGWIGISLYNQRTKD